MNWKAIWTAIRTNPFVVAFWTAFVGALGEQFLRMANSGSFDWTAKGVDEMMSAAVTTAILSLIHLYTQPKAPVCSLCGLVLDRDYNAAVNIKNLGLDRAGLARIAEEQSSFVNACGDTSFGTSGMSDVRNVSLKQEAPSFSYGV